MTHPEQFAESLTHAKASDQGRIMREAVDIHWQHRWIVEDTRNRVWQRVASHAYLQAACELVPPLTIKLDHTGDYDTFMRSDGGGYAFDCGSNRTFYAATPALAVLQLVMARRRQQMMEGMPALDKAIGALLEASRCAIEALHRSLWHAEASELNRAISDVNALRRKP